MSAAARRLLENSSWLLNLWAMYAAFLTYFSMYMFRKPFTAASFDRSSSDGSNIAAMGVDSWSDGTAWDQKSIIVAAQVIGYLISKMVGVKIISSLQPGKRAVALLSLIGISHCALLLFAVLPSPLHIAAIFLNGLPLGMVFGLVLGFLEGRRMTEALTAGLCASFILAGGFSKTLGSWVLQYLHGTMGLGIESAERWMPFGAGMLFLLPLTAGVWMLVQVPPPTAPDIQARSPRAPMNSNDRRATLYKFGVGIGAVALVYFLTTILRSIRDDFAPEIFAGLGAAVSAMDYTRIDLIVATIVLVVNGLSVLVAENRRALILSLVVCLIGFISILTSLLLIEAQILSASGFMVVLGAGLYLPYVAIHTTVFERMIALTRDRSNLAFLIYVVDSLGYLGYVGIMLLRNFLPSIESDRSAQLVLAFRWICWGSAIISILSVLIAILYFWRIPEVTASSTGIGRKTALQREDSISTGN